MVTITRAPDDGYTVTVGTAQASVTAADLVAILAGSLRKDDLWELVHSPA